MRARRTWLAALSTLLLCLSALPASAAGENRVVVYAAASLKNALDGIAKDWQASSGNSVAISYAGSSALARQIEQGAPADIFISADSDWMNYLETRGQIVPDSRIALLANRIVLIAPKGTKNAVDIRAPFDLAPLLAGGKLAMANVTAVPAGKYGKAALLSLGAWAGVAAQVAQADNVRAALALVARSEAPLGIVYATDAKAEAAVEIIGTFPEGSHPAIVYPFARTRTGAGHAAAAAFMAHLTSAAARAAFEAQGFIWKGPS